MYPNSADIQTKSYPNLDKKNTKRCIDCQKKKRNMGQTNETTSSWDIRSHHTATLSSWNHDALKPSSHQSDTQPAFPFPHCPRPFSSLLFSSLHLQPQQSDATTTAALLLVAAAEDAAETKAAKELVEAETAEQAVEKTAETEAAQLITHISVPWKNHNRLLA